jgi:tRNA dimethylallyltransferase
MIWDKIKNSSQILIYGATASGKSALAEKIAQKIGNTIIINGDSRQVYREIPIITAQPKIDKYHKLYGIISSKDQFSVADWLSYLEKELLQNYKRKIIIVGGTGLYLESMMVGLSSIPMVKKEIYESLEKRLKFEGFDKLYCELLQKDPDRKILKNDKQRLIRAIGVLEETGKNLSYWQEEKKKPLLPESDILKIYLKPSRELLYQRINNRFLAMLEEGALEEADNLIKNRIIAPKIIGLEEICGYLAGNYSKEYMIEKAQQKTRNYAKRQETWFKNRLKADLIIASEQYQNF